MLFPIIVVLALTVISVALILRGQYDLAGKYVLALLSFVGGQTGQEIARTQAEKRRPGRPKPQPGGAGAGKQ